MSTIEVRLAPTVLLCHSGLALLLGLPILRWPQALGARADNLHPPLLHWNRAPSSASHQTRSPIKSVSQMNLVEYGECSTQSNGSRNPNFQLLARLELPRFQPLTASKLLFSKTKWKKSVREAGMAQNYKQPLALRSESRVRPHETEELLISPTGAWELQQAHCLLWPPCRPTVRPIGGDQPGTGTTHHELR